MLYVQRLDNAWLFNDFHNKLQTFNVWVTVGDKLEKTWKKAVVAFLKYCNSMWINGLGKRMRISIRVADFQAEMWTWNVLNINLFYLIVVYLMTLRGLYCTASNDLMIVNNEMEKISKEEAEVQFKVLFWHSTGETEENNWKSVMITGVLVKIETEHFLNMSQKLYFLSQLASSQIKMHHNTRFSVTNTNIKSPCGKYLLRFPCPIYFPQQN